MSVALSVLVTALSIYNLRDTSIKSAILKAEAISEAVKSGLTSHMINNNMGQKDIFIDSISNMPNVEKLWLSRSPLVAEQYGDTESSEIPRDEMDKRVVVSGKMEYKIKESLTRSSMRITIPYNAEAQRGIDCLSCHNVAYGSTLGAISLELDISDLKQLGYETIYAIIIIIILGVIIIIFFAKRILNPYVTLFDSLGNSLKKSIDGNFKKIAAPAGLTSDDVTLVEDYNNIMDTFSNTSMDIDKKLKGFVGGKSNSCNLNPLNESKEIILNLSNLYQFKKEIELDNTKEEIYNRLSQVFKRQFKLKNFTFIEIDMIKEKQTIVVEEGNKLYCSDIIEESPELCRSARTKHDVFSIDHHSSCPYFTNDEKFHYCTNVEISNKIQLVINFVCDTKEELEYLKDEISFIRNYINEAAPSIEVKILMNALKESAFRDGLTGLYNRKFLDEHSKKLIPYAKREKIKIGVLMLDMDHFKAVNDEYGHDIGDKVLKELSRILEENVRESDIVVRYGGEEFIVLLVGIVDEEASLNVANKIREKVRENEIDVYAGSKLKKTISIGLSMFPSDSNTLDGAMKNADIALYEAKSSGRDKVVRFKQEQVSSIDLF